MNDREREIWIDNDEGLYRWQIASKLSKRAFVRRYRAEITAHILAVVKKPPAPKTWRDYY
jgi:hypothetical protein